MEENNYYPFGLEHKGYNNVVNGTQNKYHTYNGKELEESLGYNMLEYGFRNYDATIGRWNVMDVHSELYYEVSPYNYAMNSPINFIDYMGLDPIYRNGKYYDTNDDGEEEEVSWDYVLNWIQNNDGIEATYTFTTNKSGYARLTNTSEEGNERNSFVLEGKTYEANSYMTLMGRDDKKNNVGDFKDIETLEWNVISQVLGQASYVIYDLYKGAIERAMLGESIGGKLDYKNVLYDMMGFNRASLIQINGVVYNPNEVGNFLWGMILEYMGGLISPNLVAQMGTKGRDDERWEQKAISAGRAYGAHLYETATPAMKELILKHRLSNRY